MMVARRNYLNEEIQLTGCQLHRIDATEDISIFEYEQHMADDNVEWKHDVLQEQDLTAN